MQFAGFYEIGPPGSACARVNFTLRFRKQANVLPTLTMARVKQTPGLNFLQLYQRSDATGKVTDRKLKDITRDSSYKNLINF